MAPLGHRQGLLMAIADLAAFNSQTHGDSSPQHSGLIVARTRGRPQTAPNPRGSSPGRPRSAGSVSPDRGLKVLLSVPCVGSCRNVYREELTIQAEIVLQEEALKKCGTSPSCLKQILKKTKLTIATVTSAVHACSAFCPTIVQRLMHVLSALSNAGVSLSLCICCMLHCQG